MSKHLAGESNTLQMPPGARAPRFSRRGSPRTPVGRYRRRSHGEYGRFEYGGLPVNYPVMHCYQLFSSSHSDDGAAALIDRGRHAGPHQHDAIRRNSGTRRSCRAGPGRPLRSAQQALESLGRRLRPRAGSWQHEPTWMSAQPARSTAAVDLTGRLRRIGNRTARDRDSPSRHATERPHHARSVSISRSTCMASARSDSSSASSSASARIAAAAFRRAASIRADRTAADTAVPSLVKTSSAFFVSSSGRKVIVSAIATVYDVL